jgi:hypothetical protein
MIYIKSQRIKLTSDKGGILSNASASDYNFNFIENYEKRIPAGIYDIKFLWSSRFQAMNPHIIVPTRTYIEIHPANKWQELEGCLAPGTIDGDMVDNSRIACEKLYALIRLQTNPQIQIIDIV